MDIYKLLSSRPHNPHYLKRYCKFISSMNNIHMKNETEIHHICPKAKDMFPEYKNLSQFPWNKIHLTYREHFIAHWMLWKAFPQSFSQFYSFDHFSNKTSINSTTYSILKKQRSVLMSGPNNYFSKNKFLGENNGFYGKDHSEQFKLEASIRAKNRLTGKTWVDLYGLEKALEMKEARSSDKNVSKRDDVRNKISQSLKGKTHSREHRKKLSDSRIKNYIKRIWIHNNLTEKLINHESDIPEGYIKGRLK